MTNHETLDNALDTFEKMHELENGWAGKNSICPSPDTISNAFGVYGLVLDNSDVFIAANSDGTINLGWINGTKRVDIQFDRTSARVLRWDSKQCETPDVIELHAIKFKISTLAEKVNEYF